MDMESHSQHKSNRVHAEASEDEYPSRRVTRDPGEQATGGESYGKQDTQPRRLDPLPSSHQPQYDPSDYSEYEARDTRQERPTPVKPRNVERPSSARHVEGKNTTIIGADDTEGQGAGGKVLTCLAWILVVCTFPISLCCTLKVVQEYERAVIFRLGRLTKGGARGPGIFCVLPCTDSFTKVDLRVISFDVPPQEILTKDSVTVAVDAVVYYRVFNATISVANVENAQYSTQLLAQTTLRNILGQHDLSEILSERDSIAKSFRDQLDEATDPWGIQVERVEIKDVRLPVQLQRAMAAEAEATREAKAKVIAAEGEHKASRALKEAADVINQSPAALQLRYLQTLNMISAERNSTIIFPFPIEMLKGIKT